MATVAASKMLTAAVDVAVSSSAAASLAHHRSLTCCAAAAAVAAAAAAAAASRLVPHPPDLIRWVRRQGGFVHPKLKITDRDPHGLGIIAIDDIPPGSELITLPSHLPLRFDRSLESDDGGDGLIPL